MSAFFDIGNLLGGIVRRLGAGRRDGRRNRSGRPSFRLRGLEPLEERALLSVYFVNDGDTALDQWCTRPGDDAYSGKYATVPKASVQAILDSYNLEPGDVIRIDTGRYYLSGNITIAAEDSGTSAKPLVIEGSPYGVTLDRGDAAPGSCGIQIDGASFVTIRTASSTKYAAAQRWMRVTGAYDGIYVAGDHATLRGLDATGNLHSAISVVGHAADYATIENSLARGSSGADGAGIRIEQADSVTVRNATMVGNVKYALYVADAVNPLLRDSILRADGAGAYSIYCSNVAGGSSDYNDMYPTAGANVAYYEGDRPILADWNAATGQDANSISKDPQFADLAGGDLHLKSNGRVSLPAGTGGGRYDPETNLPPLDPAAWAVDSVTSPGIDAGDPASAYAKEPAPSGGRVNLGAYGNTEQASASDTVAPQLLGYGLVEDTGQSRIDFLTNDTTPTLGFLFSEVITGLDADVIVEDPSGDPVAVAVAGWETDRLSVTFPAPLSENGEYTVTLNGTAAICDSAGNALAGGVQIRHFTLDAEAPTVATVALVEDTGTSGSDRITSDTTPTLVVTFTEPVFGNDDDVEVYGPQGDPIAPDRISGWGTDTLMIVFETALADGEYRVVLKGTSTIEDEAGNPLGGGADEEVCFTIDTQAPSVTGNFLEDDRGWSPSDQITNDTTPTLTFTFDEVVHGIDADVTVLDPSGDPATPDGISGWGTDTLLIAFSTPLAEEGEYTVTLKGTTTITDTAGNPLGNGSDEERHFTLDTTPPEIVSSVMSEDTGISPMDMITSDTTPEFTIRFSEVVYGTDADVIVLDPSGDPVAPDSIAGWGTDTLVIAFTTPLAEEGQYTGILKGTSTILDAAGNPLYGGQDAVGLFTIDTRGPTVTGYELAEDNGPSAADQITNDATPELSIAFSEAVYGTDADVIVVDPSGDPIAPDSITGWGTDALAIALSTPLEEEGTYRVTLNGTTTVADAAGNPLGDGADAEFEFTLDFHSPSLTDYWLLTDTGVDSGDRVTSDDTPELHFLFDKPVYGTDGDVIVTGPAGGAVAPDSIAGWGTSELIVAFTEPLAEQGEYAVTLKGTSTIEDLAGNPLGGGADEVRHFTLDREPPTAAIIEVVPDPRTGAVDQIEIDFSEPVYGFDLSDLALARDGGGNLLGGAEPLTTADNVHWVLAGLTGLTGLPGQYALVLTAAGSGVTDAAGNALANDAREEWTVHPTSFTGTSGDDEFIFVAGNPWHTVTVTLNGGSPVTYQYPASESPNLTFNGLGGYDTILITGGPGNDTAALRKGTVDVVGADYQVHGKGMETIHVEAGGGTSQFARLYDSSGNDRFVVGPRVASMADMDHPELYANSVSGFDKIYGTTWDRGTDEAHFYDSTGNDIFVARASQSYMVGAGYFNLAAGFEQVFGHATAGGTGDRAYLYDSPVDDSFVFHASPVPTGEIVNSSGYLRSASGFDYTCGRSLIGGIDEAHLYDSPGDDLFVGRPTSSYLVGPGFSAYALAFPAVAAHAVNGGNDEARLYDAPAIGAFPAGDDTLNARPVSSELVRPGVFSLQAEGFDKVSAFATSGTDVAHFFDSPGDDTLKGTPTYAQMKGPGYDNYASAFDEVYADATAGGTADNDRAELYDSAGNDSFWGHLVDAVLSDGTLDDDSGGLTASGSYYHRLSGFAAVDAYGMAGPTNHRTIKTPVDYLLSFHGEWIGDPWL
jgi:hypothetical protein